MGIFSRRKKDDRSTSGSKKKGESPPSGLFGYEGTVNDYIQDISKMGNVHYLNETLELQTLADDCKNAIVSIFAGSSGEEKSSEEKRSRIKATIIKKKSAQSSSS
jgi:hypothetical protein